MKGFFSFIKTQTLFPPSLSLWPVAGTMPRFASFKLSSHWQIWQASKMARFLCLTHFSEETKWTSRQKPVKPNCQARHSASACHVRWGPVYLAVPRGNNEGRRLMYTLNEKYKRGLRLSAETSFSFKGLQKMDNWQQSFTICWMESRKKKHVFLHSGLA